MRPRLNYMGLILGAEEAGLSVLTETQIIAILRKLHLEPALAWMSRVNIALTSGGAQDPEFQRFLANLLFQEAWLGNLRAATRRLNATYAAVLDPRIMRALIKLTWLHADVERGHSPVDDPICSDIGHVVLSLVSSLTSKGAVKGPDSDSQLDSLLDARVLFARFGYHPRHDHQRVLPIKDSILNDLLSDPDVRAKFKEVHGVDAVDIMSAHFALMTYFSQGTPTYFKTFESLHVDYRFLFGQLGLSRKVADWFILATSPTCNADRLMMDAGMMCQRLWTSGFCSIDPMCVSEATL